MSVELEVGTTLVATHKGATYRAVIVRDEEGEAALAVTEAGGSTGAKKGQLFSSLSGAGRALTGAKAVGGRRFWTVEDRDVLGDAEALYEMVARERKAESAHANGNGNGRTAAPPVAEPRKGHRQIKRKGEARRYFCDACMASFKLAADEPEPAEKCPAGHPAYAEDLGR